MESVTTRDKQRGRHQHGLFLISALRLELGDRFLKIL
jgi:hypothetical protein